jgi:hypothetical protein
MLGFGTLGQFPLGGAPFSITILSASVGAFTETGIAASFKFSELAAAGGCSFAGFAATLTRDYVNWVRDVAAGGSWRGAALPSSPWTEASPIAPPSTPWTVDPAQQILPPVSE